MPSDLCRRAKELARRFDSGPALSQLELATWWRFRSALAKGDIHCVASDEVLPCEVTVNGRRFKAGTKILAVLLAIRNNAGAAVGFAASVTAWGMRIPVNWW